ncbi:hypothetical protein DIPPA_01503 [Diplonema papillatum]|nr:hypothetical protein DIPPA_01503 [Diplonema papillatum]
MARFSPPREDGPYQFEIRREWEEPLGAEVKNMVVQRVLPGSPAYRAGLRPGMAVLRVGGRRVETVAELSRLVGAAGERFTITANANGALADDSPRSSGRRYVPDPHDGGDETLRLVRGEYHPKSPGRGRSVSSEVAPEPFSGPPTPRTGRKQFRQQHETYAPSFWEEQNVRSHSPYITENPIHRSPPHQSPGLDGTMQWDRVERVCLEGWEQGRAKNAVEREGGPAGGEMLDVTVAMRDDSSLPFTEVSGGMLPPSRRDRSLRLQLFFENPVERGTWDVTRTVKVPTTITPREVVEEQIRVMNGRFDLIMNPDDYVLQCNEPPGVVLDSVECPKQRLVDYPMVNAKVVCEEQVELRLVRLTDSRGWARSSKNPWGRRGGVDAETSPDLALSANGRDAGVSADIESTEHAAAVAALHSFSAACGESFAAFNKSVDERLRTASQRITAASSRLHRLRSADLRRPPAKSVAHRTLIHSRSSSSRVVGLFSGDFDADDSSGGEDAEHPPPPPPPQPAADAERLHELNGRVQELVRELRSKEDAFERVSEAQSLREQALRDLVESRDRVLAGGVGALDARVRGRLEQLDGYVNDFLQYTADRVSLMSESFDQWKADEQHARDAAPAAQQKSGILRRSTSKLSPAAKQASFRAGSPPPKDGDSGQQLRSASERTALQKQDSGRQNPSQSAARSGPLRADSFSPRESARSQQGGRSASERAGFQRQSPPPSRLRRQDTSPSVVQVTSPLSPVESEQPPRTPRAKQRDPACAGLAALLANGGRGMFCDGPRPAASAGGASSPPPPAPDAELSRELTDLEADLLIEQRRLSSLARITYLDRREGMPSRRSLQLLDEYHRLVEHSPTRRTLVRNETCPEFRQSWGNAVLCSNCGNAKPRCPAAARDEIRRNAKQDGLG